MTWGRIFALLLLDWKAIQPTALTVAVLAVSGIALGIALPGGDTRTTAIGAIVLGQVVMIVFGSIESGLKDPLWDNRSWVIRLGVPRPLVAAVHVAVNWALLCFPCSIALSLLDGSGLDLSGWLRGFLRLAAASVLLTIPTLVLRHSWQVIAGFAALIYLGFELLLTHRATLVATVPDATLHAFALAAAIATSYIGAASLPRRGAAAAVGIGGAATALMLLFHVRPY